MSFQGKTIWFVGGGRQALPAVKLAKSLGAKVVVSDYDNNCPCFGIADYCIIASTMTVTQQYQKQETFITKFKKLMVSSVSQQTYHILLLP